MIMKLSFNLKSLEVRFNWNVPSIMSISRTLFASRLDGRIVAISKDESSKEGSF